MKQPKIFNVFIDLLNDTRNDLSLKGDIVDFLPAILQHCSDEQALQVKDALKNLITSHFPMNSADLTVGESKYIEYMTCLNKVRLFHFIVIFVVVLFLFIIVLLIK